MKLAKVQCIPVLPDEDYRKVRQRVWSKVAKDTFLPDGIKVLIVTDRSCDDEYLNSKQRDFDCTEVRIQPEDPTPLVDSSQILNGYDVDPSQFKVVIIHTPKIITPTAVNELRKYVTGIGGTVYLTSDSIDMDLIVEWD